MPEGAEHWPAAPAWYSWRDAKGGLRLGVLDPATKRYLDLGALDPVQELAAGRLDADHLRDLCAKLTSTGTTGPGGDPDRGDAASFAPPVPRPGKVLCLGKNFAAHAAEFGAEVPPEPIVFNKLPGVLVGHGADVVLPHWVTTRVDHEVELVAVLGFPDPEGSGRKHVTADEGLDLVSGYTAFNDVTARKMQGEDRKQQWPWLRCKSFDTFGPIGPWVVPAESLGDLRDKRIRLWVDGELRQSSDLGNMVVGVGQAIAYLSRHFALHPGDLIAMGTPEGVGPLEAGQTVHCTIDGIGTLEHGVRREADPG